MSLARKGGIKMEKFIRLDQKGHWRGTEHRSMLADPTETYIEYDDDGEFEVSGGKWESGISCYHLGDDVAYAIDRLRWYWMNVAMMKDASDYAGMQVTIFEGERIGEGSDGEDTATCSRTIAEFDAEPFMEQIIKTWKQMEYDEEIDEEEYKNILEKLIKELL